MPGLNELQVNFKRYLMTGYPAIAAHIASVGESQQKPRLAVYANAYRARLVEALAADYEALKAVLGDDSFIDLCHDYLDAHPSTGFSLRSFGQHLPDYLRRVHRRQPYLGELAEFEWLLTEAFDAPDAPVVGVEDVSRIPPGSWACLRMRLHPSVHRLRLNWNVVNIRQSAKDTAAIPAAERLPEPVACIIWRDGLTTQYRSLMPDEESALVAAEGGATFTELCEQLAAHDVPQDQVPLRAAGLLKTWLTSALISEVLL